MTPRRFRRLSSTDAPYESTNHAVHVFQHNFNWEELTFKGQTILATISCTIFFPPYRKNPETFSKNAWFVVQGTHEPQIEATRVRRISWPSSRTGWWLGVPRSASEQQKLEEKMGFQTTRTTHPPKKDETIPHRPNLKTLVKGTL